MSHHRTSRALRHRRSAAAAAACLALAIAAGTLLTAGDTGPFADPGPTRTEQRPVEGVHAVDLRTSGDLTITTGATPKLAITAGRTTLRYLTSTLQDGTVVLGSRSGHNASGDIHYELTLPTLDGVAIAGSGSAHGTVVADGPFTVIVSGSGSAALDGLAATAVTVQLSGSGDIHLAGSTDAQSVEVDGSGTYLGSDLTSRTSDVQIDGSGNAHVNAIGPLDAQINGSGNIFYTGTPVLTTHTSGNGTISAG
ncbi:MAG: head GIN domain-containing protein [Pseudonocardiales bacterium]